MRGALAAVRRAKASRIAISSGGSEESSISGISNEENRRHQAKKHRRKKMAANIETKRRRNRRKPLMAMKNGGLRGGDGAPARLAAQNTSAGNSGSKTASAKVSENEIKSRRKIK